MCKISDLESVLEQRGISLPDLKLKTSEIVLFGSWAIGKHSKHSDIDLLCVGTGQRTKTREIDLVWRTAEEINSPHWLGSELANHIAKFGIWIKGSGEWRKRVFLSKRAISYKRRLISGRIGVLGRVWHSLPKEYRIKHVIKLRRDIQRLVLLIQGTAIPASPILDEKWNHTSKTNEVLVRLLSQANHEELLPDYALELIAPYLGFSEWR